MILAHDIEENLRTQDVKITEDVTFDTMLLTTNTLFGLHESGFYRPSPIQLHGIPLGKCGFDLLLEAKSGTGKTAVFSVIALEKLDLNKGVQVIILAPTREIAAQICDVIKQIGSGYIDLSVEVVMGGLPVQDDIAKFKKKTHIVVGSPGRLRHLIQDKHIDIAAVRLLVLDEADKLMDKSFQADINYIFSILPKQKQVIMSSATYPEQLKVVINKYVSNAQHICPDSTSILLGIKQLYTVVKRNSNIVSQTQHRFQELLKIISKKQFKQCLIFCNYQVRVAELSKMLMREKWPAEQLHGQQEQTDRLEALKTLQQYKCRILVSTDLAARGIDASNVDLVINFEPPYEWQTYLHRIGRAGRFGSYGIAITILSEGQEQIKFKKMLESISVSLKLKNFWDDDESNSDMPNESTENIETPADENLINTKPDEINQELKKAFNLNNEGNVENVVSLDLNKTIDENEECVIDSFNELIISFNTENDTADIVPYQHIQFHPKTFDENNKSISTDNIQDQTKQSASSHKLEGNILNNESQTNVQVTDRSYNDVPENVNQDSRFTQFKHKLKERLRKKLQQETNDADDSEYCYNTAELRKALIEAGLPTAFGRPQIDYEMPTKNYSDLNYKSRLNYYKAQDIGIPQKSTNLQGSYKLWEIKTRSQYTNNKCMNNLMEKLKENNSHATTDDTNNTRSSNDLHTHYKQYGKQNSETDDEVDEVFSEDASKAMPSNSKLYDSDTGSCEEEAGLDTAREQYYSWYHKLKAHVKRVQMLAYIDELAKLNHQ